MIVIPVVRRQRNDWIGHCFSLVVAGRPEENRWEHGAQPFNVTLPKAPAQVNEMRRTLLCKPQQHY